VRKVTVKVSELEKDPCNFRKDTGDLTDLKESLKRGQYKPIIIRYIMDKPHVLCGWRTVLAARELGVEALEAVVVDVDDLEALRMSWLDNESLKPWSEEERKAHVVFLYNMFRALGMSKSDAVLKIAETLNRSDRWVYQYLPEGEKEEEKVKAGGEGGRVASLKRKVKMVEEKGAEASSARKPSETTGKGKKEKTTPIKEVAETVSATPYKEEKLEEKPVGGGEPVKTKKPKPKVVSGTIVGKEDLSWIWSIYELDSGYRIAVRGSRVFAGRRGRDFRVGERVEAVLDWSYLVRGAPEAIDLKPLLGELPVDITEEIGKPVPARREPVQETPPAVEAVHAEAAAGGTGAGEGSSGGKPRVMDVLEAVNLLATRFQARLLSGEEGSRMYEIGCTDGLVVVEVKVF